MKYIVVLAVLLSSTINSYSQQFRKIRECVIVNGVLKEIEADYDPATGDRTILVNGARKDFYAVYPKSGAGYAEGQGWFINNEAVPFKGKSYVKYGLPRILGVNEIIKAGEYKGVNVYAEAGLKGLVEVIYLPVRQGCEFQPYQVNCGTADVVKLVGNETTLQLKVNVTGKKGKLTYNWSSPNAKIIKGQGTAQVTLDIKERFDGDRVEVSVTVNEAQNCPLQKFANFYLEKKKKAPVAQVWPEVEQQSFMTECVKSAQLEANLAKQYCSCMLEKIMKLFPDVLVAEKKVTQEVIKPLAKECLAQPAN